MCPRARGRGMFWVRMISIGAARRAIAPARVRAARVVMTSALSERLLRDANDAREERRRPRVMPSNVVSEEIGLFFAEAVARASPVALGVVAARIVGEVVESFIDAFVSPSVAILLGSRGRGLAQMKFRALGVEFPYGAFVEQMLEAVWTLALVFLAVRLAAGVSRRSSTPLWTPSARCVACKSWIARDATRCPMCRARAVARADADADADADARSP